MVDNQHKAIVNLVKQYNKPGGGKFKTTPGILIGNVIEGDSKIIRLLYLQRYNRYDLEISIIKHSHVKEDVLARTEISKAIRENLESLKHIFDVKKDFNITVRYADYIEFLDINEMKKKKESKLKLTNILGPECDAAEQTTSGSSGSFSAPTTIKRDFDEGIEYDQDFEDYSNPENIPFNDGDKLEDYQDEKPKEQHASINYKQLKQFIKDIEHFIPDYREEIRLMYIDIHNLRSTGVEPDWNHIVMSLINMVEERGMAVSPYWRVVPQPELNEEDLDEQATSSSSGSYETPSCWATGKGKDSIKNSRAVRSKLFKRNLYGGPNARYVSIKNSVNTLAESTDIYNKNTTMKRSQIQKLIESTIKDEVMKTIKTEQKEKSIVVKENTFLKMVDTLIEEKSHPGETTYKKTHKESGTINKKHTKDSMKRTKDYNDVEGNDNPEFPHAIGGEKKARKNTKEEDEFIEDFRGGSMEDLTYDQEPDKEFQKRAYMSLVGDSIMGNPHGKDTANNIETEVGENTVKKAKRKKKKTENAPMYKKDEQPTGQQKDETLKGEALKESKDSVLETELTKIKKLYTYSDRTQ